MMTKFGFVVRKSSDGTVRICTPRLVWIVAILPSMRYEERVDRVKWSLIAANFAWTDEVENMVRNILSA